MSCSAFSRILQALPYLFGEMAENQGDQIRQIFAYWAIVSFGQLF
jgi:hypothetical protein